jgi:hypothetical protein
MPAVPPCHGGGTGTVAVRQRLQLTPTAVTFLVHAQAAPGKATKDFSSHHKGLQRLSNGEHVPYKETLRVVQHEGSRAPRVMSATTRKPPGYIRNESGGMFTS